MKRKIDATIPKLDRAEVNSFVEIIDSPGVGCIPYTAPLVMLRRDIKLIEVLDDQIWILGEYDVLVVDTTHFAPHQSGNAWDKPDLMAFFVMASPDGLASNSGSTGALAPQIPTF